MTRDELKEIFTQWKYHGMKLCPWHQMIRHLIAWPFIQFLKILLVIFVAIGWGLSEAEETWKELS